MSRSMLINLTYNQFKVIQSALLAVSPSGGGSDVYTLLQHIQSITRVAPDNEMALGFQRMAAAESDTKLYIVREYAVTSVFSTLEKAKQWCESERNPTRDPEPYVWTEIDTDMREVKEWHTKRKWHSGDTEEIVIVSCLLDRTPEELAS